MMLKTYCPIDRAETVLEVDEAGYSAWMNGALVQDAFPALTPDQREALITGICPPCWDNMFATAEEA